MKWTRPFQIVIVVLILMVAVSAAWAASDKAVIEIKNKAQSDGAITFTFTPTEGEAKEIEIGVINKMKAEEIARDVMKQFTLAIGDGYEVKVSSQKVKIRGVAKKKADAPTFDIVLSGNSVSGVSVVIK
jgi:hypothetical protein